MNDPRFKLAAPGCARRSRLARGGRPRWRRPRLLVFGVLVMAAGCGGSNLSSLQIRSPILLEIASDTGIQQTAGTSTSAAPPMLMVPAVGNAAQNGVFEELTELRSEHDQLSQEVAATRMAAEELRTAIDAERIETRRTKSDVGMLQQQISEMSRDLQDWKSDVAESRRQFHDQQTRDLAALEELNLTVEMLIEQARLIVSPNAVTRDGATSGWTGTDQNAAPSLESNQ